jgi:glycosyltransferase involved in cell wall biosynthesis
MTFEFDILIASFDRPNILENCLESIFFEKPQNLKNIIVLTRREDHGTIDLVKKFENGENLKLVLINEKIPPGAARNILVRESNAEYLHFLDDDAIIPEGYYQKASGILSASEFDVIGGPDQSPKHSSITQQVLGKVLESQFVMGPTATRHSVEIGQKIKASEVELTLCNLWIRASIFKKDDIFFDEDLMRCEENVLLEKLSSNNDKMFYFSDLFVYHTRRESLKDLALIQYNSGFYRGICFHKSKKLLKPFFLLPLLTGLILILLPFLPVRLISTLILFHVIISTFISANIMVELKEASAFFLSWVMIALIHIFFSIGLLFGTIRGFIK